jgi:Fic family protein
MTSQHKKIYRLAVTVPRIPIEMGLNNSILARLTGSDNKLSQLQNHRHPAGLDTFLKKQRSFANLVSMLRHELSAHAMARDISKTKIRINYGQHNKEVSKSALEAKVLFRKQEYLLAPFANTDYNSFVQLLEGVASDAQGKTQYIRTKAVSTAADSSGYYREYPPAEQIHDNLDKLHRFLQNSEIKSPLFKAMVALVILNCIHPFQDGNGRTSRILFNAVLQQHGMPYKTYIPCKEIFDWCQHGFTIRLRKTYMTNDWSEITIFFCDLIDFCDYLIREDADFEKSD